MIDEAAWPAYRGERTPIDWLKPDPRNARTHSDAQLDQIVALIRRLGWTSPILADADGNILAGHGRWRAALRLGLATVPVLVAPATWSDEDKRLYALADNQVALNAGWDAELLAIELAELAEAGADLGLAGFDDAALAALAGPDAAAIAAAKLATVETGDVADVFWIQVEGPLALQADALARLRAIEDEFPAIRVRLGTTPREP